MHNVSIEITAPAKIDLDEIWTQIAQTDFQRADRFVAKLEAKIGWLSQFPESGVERSDIFPQARVLIDGQYLIFYQLVEQVVIVMRIVHGARDLSEINFS
jgi:toxin ParE1/3/4